MKSVSKQLLSIKFPSLVGFSVRQFITGNILLFSIALMFLAGSCKKKETLSTSPTVSTSAITDIAPSSAKGGGNIISNGSKLILASGLCYSSINQVPTVTDDTTRTAILTGAFTSTLNDLSSNTTYYVRAYATNEIGTGYGEVRSFTTGNEAPVALNVTITGEIKGDMELTATYTYNDKEGDAENGTTIQWYRADNASGQNTVPISEATTNKYRISDADENKVLWVGVTPKATTGTQVGVETISEKTTPVGAATTVTFMYNGAEVTYGIISSTKTGRRWLDRNLGALNLPTSFLDAVNLGDLFQWGRLADGHQLLTRSADIYEFPVPVNPTTTILSSTDAPVSPDDKKFIKIAASPYDWRGTPNNMLWQGVNGINNPCPTGWRVPTIDEWTAEQLVKDRTVIFAQMKLTASDRRYTDGSFTDSREAYYWSSSAAVNNGYNRASMLKIYLFGDPAIEYEDRAQAAAVRCIRDL